MTLAQLTLVVSVLLTQSSWSQAPRRPNQPADVAAAGKTAQPQGAIRNADDPRVKEAVARAVAFLKGKAAEVKGLGELALMAHALAKARAKYPDVLAPDDPTLQGMIAVIQPHCADPFAPGGHDNYDAGVVAMALAAYGGPAYKAELTNVAKYIMAWQLPNGAWSYHGHHPGGDTSQTQYAILGLWEAADGAGVPIPPEVWDKTAKWHIETQTSSGGFAYHPNDPAAGFNEDQPTHTMTAASLGTLYICREHLPGGQQRGSGGQILKAVQEVIPTEGYKPQTDPADINKAIDRAAGWMKANFTLDKARGQQDPGGRRWLYYYLYALERYATLAEKKEINGVDWYAKGAELLLSKQQDNGSWRTEQNSEGPEVQTSFAILFLVRSTLQSKILHDRLGGGILVGHPGGLAPYLKKMDQEASRVNASYVPASPEDLPASVTYEKKWSAIGEEGARLRKLLEKGLKTQNSEVIKKALQLLALTGDYRVVPLLIDGMYYEDDPEVQLAARESLCLISRKFHGFEYPEEPTLEEWKEEIDKWKAWYRSVRPEAEFEDEVVEIK